MGALGIRCRLAQHTMAANNMENSLFGRLPPELRDAVYSMVLVPPRGTTIEVPVKKDYLTCTSDGRSATHVPPLLRVCRKICEEASKIYFNRNEVTIRREDAFLGARRLTPVPERKFWISKGLLPLGRVLNIYLDLGLYVEADMPLRDIDQGWDKLAQYIRPVLRTLRPERIIVRFEIEYHRFGGLRFPTPEAARPTSVHEGVPLSLVESGRLALDFDPTVMESMIGDFFTAKQAQLDAHASPAVHPVCPVRAERRNLLRGLSEKRALMMVVLSRMRRDFFYLAGETEGADAAGDGNTA